MRKLFTVNLVEQINNLSLISKILEKVVANRLQTHIKTTIYLIHYNQPTGNIILQNQLY